MLTVGIGNRLGCSFGHMTRIFQLRILRGNVNVAGNHLHFEGFMSRSSVDALSELCSPFLKGGNFAFIAAIASGLFPRTNIGHSNNYGPNGPNRKKIDSNF